MYLPLWWDVATGTVQFELFKGVGPEGLTVVFSVWLFHINLRPSMCNSDGFTVGYELGAIKMDPSLASNGYRWKLEIWSWEDNTYERSYHTFIVNWGPRFHDYLMRYRQTCFPNAWSTRQVSQKTRNEQEALISKRVVVNRNPEKVDNQLSLKAYLVWHLSPTALSWDSTCA